MDSEPPRWEPGIPFDAESFVDDAVRNAVNAAAKRSRRHDREDGPAGKAGADSAAHPRLIFDDTEWSESDIEPRPWIARGYMMRGAVTAIVGSGAAGKSSLMVSWAIALVLGVKFHRMTPVEPVRVMTYNCEDDQSEQRRRFSAALRAFGRSPADLAGKLSRVTPQRVGTLFYKDEAGFIGPTPAMRELRARLEAFRPSVLIVDPLVEMHDVDENHNSDMREVMASLRSLAVKFNLAVVVVHHTRKGVVTPGDPEAARGASAVKDLCRVALTLTVMQPEDAKAFNIKEDDRHLYFRLDDAKQNYSAMGSAQWFERHVVPLDNEDFVATAQPWNPPIDVVTPEKQLAIEEALARGTGDGPYSNKLDKSPRSFRTLCIEHGIVTSEGQSGLLARLLTAEGYCVRKFRKPSNRALAAGIQTPDGSPRTANWQDNETDRSGDE